MPAGCQTQRDAGAYLPGPRVAPRWGTWVPIASVHRLPRLGRRFRGFTEVPGEREMNDCDPVLLHFPDPDGHCGILRKGGAVIYRAAS